MKEANLALVTSQLRGRCGFQLAKAGLHLGLIFCCFGPENRPTNYRKIVPQITVKMFHALIDVLICRIRDFNGINATSTNKKVQGYAP